MRSRYLLLAFTLVSTVDAQPIPCDECTRGDAIIDKFSLQPVRPLAGELAALSLADPMTTQQYEHIVQLRARTPALGRLAAVDDADLALVAAALCHAPNNACTAATARALRCLADRCAVALPEDRHPDVLVNTEPCNRYITHKRSPRFGVGFDWGTGVERSRYPNDGRVWSIGIEARAKVTERIGAVARVDRTGGRDAGEDTDGNGRDDMSTGAIIRVSALAGPSLVLDKTKLESTVRFVRLDLLGGYLATRSQANEDGPAAGADLSFEMWAFRTGIRYVQGFGDASDARMVLAHLGFVAGGRPDLRESVDCDGSSSSSTRSTRLAVGLDIPLGGYGFSSELGYLATGLGVEAIWHLLPAIDVMTRADLLLFPGDERDRVLHQAVLGGFRLDIPKRPGRSSRTGIFGTALGGYTHGAGLTPTKTGSGPVVDVSLGWGGQGRDGAAYFRLHGRFGVGDNTDYRAVFVSGGFEFRFDSERWRDRI